MTNTTNNTTPAIDLDKLESMARAAYLADERSIAFLQPSTILALIDLARRAQLTPFENTRLDILSMIREQCHRCYASAIDREEIDSKYMLEIDGALRALFVEVEAARRAQQSVSGNVDDLSALVRQLAHSLKKANPDSELAARAVDYLQRKGFGGSPLRASTAATTASTPAPMDRSVDCPECGFGREHDPSCPRASAATTASASDGYVRGLEDAAAIARQYSDEVADAIGTQAGMVATAPSHTVPLEKMRADFEDWFTSRFDEPLQSRECARQWSTWIAGASGEYKARDDWKISPQPWGPPDAFPISAPTPSRDAAPLDERAQFEAWAKRQGHDVVSRLETGGKFYVSSFTRHAWDIWQARVALAQQSAPQSAATDAEVDAEGLPPLPEPDVIAYSCIGENDAYSAARVRKVQREAIAADRDRRAGSTAGVPKGFKLVPVEPTPWMKTCGLDHIQYGRGFEGEELAASVYRAMLAAAPSPQSPAGSIGHNQRFLALLAAHCKAEAAEHILKPDTLVETPQALAKLVEYIDGGRK